MFLFIFDYFSLSCGRFRISSAPKYVQGFFAKLIGVRMFGTKNEVVGTGFLHRKFFEP